jgi:DNA topoisomerase-1
MTLNKTDKILVICESPNKVKTISAILKKSGYTKAVVVASVGHIMALGNGGSAYNSGVFPEQNFKMNLEIAEGKKKVVDNIKLHAKNSDKIFIMTDGDREGEVISWSLIKFCKLPEKICFRAITHEITPKAVIAALENPVPFNNNLVNAGLSRMMSDKLIGFGLSPLGKKYIGAKSIGRCQSVGLKLITDRETEIQNFIPEMYFNLYLNFVKNNQEFKAKYLGYKDELINKFTKQADVDAVVVNCKNTPYVVKEIKKINHKESPKPPFCTASFQQEAANKLGLSVKNAMVCAQKLFEGIDINGEHIGLITYHRSDSTEFAPEFLPELEQFIKNTFGKNEYKGPRKNKKKATDQDGHEAIRVVDLEMTPEELEKHLSNNLLIKVYKLIWQRTVASAMADAIISETAYIIDNNGHKFSLSSNELTNAGYKAAYEFDDNQKLNFTETFIVGEVLENSELEVLKKFTQPKARYTEASLVKELQQREIGRPSTYATIVETILSPTRGYATLEEKKITPTDRGIQLAEYCNRAFPSLINLNYTKEMEKTLDDIANGKVDYLDYMSNFYKNLKNVIDNTDEVGLTSEATEKICPKCNSSMVMRRSRFGKLFYGCSNYPKCNGIIGIN